MVGWNSTAQLWCTKLGHNGPIDLTNHISAISRLIHDCIIHYRYKLLNIKVYTSPWTSRMMFPSIVRVCTFLPYGCEHNFFASKWMKLMLGLYNASWLLQWSNEMNCCTERHYVYVINQTKSELTWETTLQWHCNINFWHTCTL